MDITAAVVREVRVPRESVGVRLVATTGDITNRCVEHPGRQPRPGQSALPGSGG